MFATVGAGAFLGGGTRQALSAAVILVEVRASMSIMHAQHMTTLSSCACICAQTTGEVHFLLPIMLSIAIAKCVR